MDVMMVERLAEWFPIPAEYKKRHVQLVLMDECAWHVNLFWVLSLKTKVAVCLPIGH
jgi:hypothetical protein